MAFNFGAFAGGLSQGIQAGQKLALEKEQLQNARDKATADLKKAEADSMSKVAKEVVDHNKTMSDLTIKMNNAKDENEYNTYAAELNSSIESFTKLYQAQTENGLLPKQAENIVSQARLQTSEPIAKVSIKDYNGKDIETYLPESMANEKDSLVLMENNKIGIAQVGEDGKIASYQPTNYSPVKFKAEKAEDRKVFKAIYPDGKVVTDAFTDSQIGELQKDGVRFETSYKPEKTTIINAGGDKNGERSPVGKAIKDWETYNQEMKTSNPEEYNKQRRQFIEDSFQARVEGVAGVSGEKKNNSKVEAIAVSADILDRETLDNKDINKLRLNQSKIIDNTTNAASRNALVKVETELKGMNATIGQLDRLDTDVDKYIKDDKLKKGLIDNIEQQANEMVGLSEDQKKNLVAIDVNTRLGIIQARFIKLMSGATVSDKEREFYTSLVGTSSWNDETALAQKIKSFSRQMKDDYSSIANEYKNELPHSYYQGTQYAKKTSGQRTQVTGTELDKETPKSTAKEIIQNGWVYDAETKKPIRKAN